MSYTKIAQDAVLGDRNDYYGDPKPDFERLAKVWSGIIGEKLKTDITPEDVPLLMVGLKLVREAHKHKDDNLIDCIGWIIAGEWAQTGKKPEKS